MSGHDVLPMNFLKALIKVSADRSVASSKCMALVVAHVKRQTYTYVGSISERSFGFCSTILPV